MNFVDVSTMIARAVHEDKRRACRLFIASCHVSRARARIHKHA